MPRKAALLFPFAIAFSPAGPAGQWIQDPVSMHVLPGFFSGDAGRITEPRLAVPTGMAPGNARDTAEVDETLWSAWWELNKHPYLRLKEHIYSASMVSDGEGFFLGRDSEVRPAGPQRPRLEEIRGVVAPTLLRLLESCRDDDLLGQVLIALAKTGAADRENALDGASSDSLSSRIEESLQRFTSHANIAVAERAILALGILGRDSAVLQLSALLEGKTSETTARPSERERAFAAYALGLLGHRTAREDVRRYIVHKLSVELDRAGDASRDLAVSCVNAIGVVPLSLEAHEEKGGQPDGTAAGSRQGQLRWLLAFFGDTRNKFFVRAHVPIALARLLEGVPSEHPLREEIRSTLIDVLGPHSRAPREIQQGAVIAAGLLGDGDVDGRNAAVSRALHRCVSTAGDPTVRNLALVALAQISSRPQQGSAAHAQIEEFLCEQLTSGRNSSRPWAALALGVLGHEQRRLHRGISFEAQATLAEEFERARSTHDLGALAVAVGLCDLDAQFDPTIALLLQGGDEATRGYAALGLGFLGQAAATHSLLEILDLADFRPLLARESAIALTLIGHADLTPSLLERLEHAQSLASLSALAPALGWNADARAIAPLCQRLSEAELPELARAEVAWALGTICAEGDLPWYAIYSVNSHYLAATPTLRSGSGLFDLP